MTTVMTTRDLYIATKRDDGISYLMNRFGFSSESDLFDAMRKVAPSKSEDLIKKLLKKQKQHQKRESKPEGQVAQNPKKSLRRKLSKILLKFLLWSNCWTKRKNSAP